MNNNKRRTVVCYGEVLWDVLPSRKIPGGAPLNVAIHLNNLGVSAKVISRIGNDNLGKGIHEFIVEKGLDTNYVQIDDTYPTGRVMVDISNKYEVSYTIEQPSAWDYIQEDDHAKGLVQSADAFVFGSLASRNQTTYDTLIKLLEHANLKVFDVNLRPPFYSKELIVKLMNHANILKVNQEELHLISNWFGRFSNDKRRIESLKSRFNLECICMTRGGEGALLLNGNGFCEEDGMRVSVKDTIGSGDAFLAAFITETLNEKTEIERLGFACLTGAYVATQSGGTPTFSRTDIEQLRQLSIIQN